MPSPQRPGRLFHVHAIDAMTQVERRKEWLEEYTVSGTSRRWFSSSPLSSLLDYDDIVQDMDVSGIGITHNQRE